MNLGGRFGSSRGMFLGLWIFLGWTSRVSFAILYVGWDIPVNYREKVFIFLSLLSYFRLAMLTPALFLRSGGLTVVDLKSWLSLFIFIIGRKFNLHHYYFLVFICTLAQLRTFLALSEIHLSSWRDSGLSRLVENSCIWSSWWVRWIWWYRPTRLSFFFASSFTLCFCSSSNTSEIRFEVWVILAHTFSSSCRIG